MKYIVCAVVFFLGVTACQPKPISVLRVVNSYPMNGALNVHPATAIGITFSSPIRKNGSLGDSIAVYGISGNKYFGAIKVSRNGRTLIFTPAKPFPLGEVIHAQFGAFETVGEAMTPSFSLSFTIRNKLAIPDTSFHSDDPILEYQLHNGNGSIGRNSNENSNSGLLPQDLPTLNIFADSNPYDGNIFICNYKYVYDQSGTYRMILDKDGNVMNAQGGGPDYFTDFKPNPNGTYSYYDCLSFVFDILDSNLTYTKTIRAANGYTTDAHEIRVTSEGNYFIIASDNVFIDMRTYIQNGWDSATIVNPIIQEFDRDSNLIFEWRAIDHFKVTDATHELLYVDYIDFCHVNAIEFDADSNLLISCRHMDEITKINLETGEIIWRWGGKNNEFKLFGDTAFFSHQHAIRRTSAGTYTMFDNGYFNHLPLQYSRAIEYRLDQTNKTATKIWEFRHNPDRFSPAMGYVQRLPNNGTFIGWGDCDSLAITELDSNNQTVFEMAMTDGNYSYRAYKYDSNYIRSNLPTASVSSLSNSEIGISVIPNPFAEAAKIQCIIVKDGYADISLYDALGREVSKIYSGFLSQGSHEFVVDAKNLAAGAYHIHGNLSGYFIDEQIVVLK